MALKRGWFKPARKNHWELTGDRLFREGEGALLHKSVVIAQLAYWVRTKEGQNRKKLQRWLSRVLNEMEGRVHGFNVATAHLWADQQLLPDRKGLRLPFANSVIVATARRLSFTIVNRQ